jgi:ADP-heptose:LPS heptosyltransferase
VPQQTQTLDRLNPSARVAIIRLRSLGDCILLTPAIHLLKQSRPDLAIAVVAEQRFTQVFEGNPDIAAVLPPSARAIRTFAPELCLNLHGGTRSARLTLLSGARFRAGFENFRPTWIYNTPIPTAQETLGITRRVHTAEHMASAIFYLGAAIAEVPRAKMYAPPGRSPHAPAASYAVVHPFAATAEKTWPAPNFIELARHLDLEPVFIGGAGDDLSPFETWRTISGASFREVARLLRDATLFIGNDSGPAHIAAAFGIPAVVLFGPSDAEIWAPWRTTARVLKAEPIEMITADQAMKSAAQAVSSVHATRQS